MHSVEQIPEIGTGFRDSRTLFSISSVTFVFARHLLARSRLPEGTGCSTWTRRIPNDQFHEVPLSCSGRSRSARRCVHSCPCPGGCRSNPFRSLGGSPLDQYVSSLLDGHEALKSIFSDPGKVYGADPCTFRFASSMILILGAAIFSIDRLIARWRLTTSRV